MAKTLEQKIVTEFNKITGLLLRTGNTANTDKIAMLIRQGQNMDTILNYAEDWYRMNPNPDGDTAMNKFYSFAMSAYATNKMPLSKAWKNGKRLVEPTSKPTVVNEPKVEPIVAIDEPVKKNEPATSANDMAGFMTGMINLVANEVVKTKTEEISKVVLDTAVEKVEQFIHDNYGDLPKKTIVQINNLEPIAINGVTHEKFGEVLVYVKKHIPVFMVGGAGTGKNVIAMQVAEALGLPFYFSNAVTQEYKITGFTDANGVYQETPFYKAWTGGGVFMLDELDASIPDVLVILNEAISNGNMDFPAPIGNVKAHKDFCLIAAGNTYGLGADYDYVGRNVIDKASLNRFARVFVDYSPAIEEVMARGDNELLGFCRSFRKATRKAGIREICSYRNIKYMAELSGDLREEDIMDSCLTSSMKVDDMRMIVNDLDGYGRWSTAFRNVIDRKRMVTA